MSDSCCLVCGQAGVIFNQNGIGGDGLSSSSSSSSFNHRQLFLYFCQSLEMTTTSRERMGAWNFKKEPFPFCDTCQLFLNSLAEVYSELEELQKVLKQKMVDGEEKYSKEKLYGRHDERYLKFRKEALGDKFLGDEELDEGEELSRVLPYDQFSDENQEEEVVLLEFELDSLDEVSRSSSTPVQSEHEMMDEDTIQTEEIPPNQNQVIDLFSEDEDLIPNTASEKDPDYQPPRKKRGRPPKKRSPTKAKNAKVNEAKLPYLKNTTNPQIGSMVANAEDGTVIFTTSYGDNQYSTKRHSLVFKEVKDAEENLIGYQCELCSENVQSSKRRPFTNMRNTEQRSFFHQHYLRFHTKRFDCLLCSDLDGTHNGREELLEHLKSKHDIPDIEAYNKVRGQHNNSKFYGRTKGKCEICMKPFPDTRKSEYRDHRWTHLSEDEKQRALAHPESQGKRRWDDIEPPSEDKVSSGAINQCQECGVFIKGGKRRLRAHELTHLNQPSFICSICGKGFSVKQSLERHMHKKHPDGKPDGRFKCKFPSCVVVSGGETELESHVGQDHGHSAEADERRMCGKCGKVAVSPWCSKKHAETVHGKEKQYQCHICHKRYSEKGTLTKHLAGVHRNGGKEWVCKEGTCDLRFHCSYNYTNHMRTKHGVFVKGTKAKQQQTSQKE
ncbi:putative zinc finger protein [Orchesella cincta]|uniref:Putative zinc finger protein n=1 Tax=Orchesella cincta TaxID=48709 RepID=A0A1D2M9E9_ORCCI|nr:putative zinc finger protein [Orchesella cincta]